MRFVVKRCTAVILSLWGSLATATPTIHISDSNLASAQAAESNLLASLQAGHLTESFESYSAGSLSKSLLTSVGTFSQVQSGFGGLCGSQCDDGVAVLDQATSPFSGRYAIDGNNWLDSWDSQITEITLNQMATGLGFYMTDANDAGGRFSIELTAGDGMIYSFQDIFSKPLSNARVFYLSFFVPEGIQSLRILANSPKDGFGIDKFSIGVVPEPATLALFGFGILCLFLANRRTLREAHIQRQPSDRGV